MLFAAIGHAQNKGEMYISGTLGVSLGLQSVSVTNGGYSESAGQPLTTSFNLGAEYGYFVIKNLRLALAASYGLNMNPSEKFDNKWYNTVTNSFQINPNIAYYVKITDKFYYTPEIGTAIAFGNIKTPLSASTSYTCPHIGWELYANIVAFECRISNHFALGAVFGNFGYGASKIIDPDNSKNSIRTGTVKFDLGSAQLNARYYF